jgi:hypothetical protein
MMETIRLGEITIQVTRKAIKACPSLVCILPAERVTLVAPSATRLDVARAYAISRLGLDSAGSQEETEGDQARETPRRFHRARRATISGGGGDCFSIAYRDAKPSCFARSQTHHSHRAPVSGLAKRVEVIHDWPSNPSFTK